MPSTRAKAALALLALLLLAGVGAISYVSYRAGQSLLHPAREAVTATPDAEGLAWEPVALLTEDGVPLVGWWMPADATPADNGTVLFLHGYSDNRAQSLEVAPFLLRAGYNVLTFDFRAHGESGGDFTTVGVLEQRDVDAALDWLAARPAFPQDPPVALFGWSMGGATGILAAVHDPRVDAVVSDSTFTDVSAVAGAGVERYTGLPPWPFGPLAVRLAAWSVDVPISSASPVTAVKDLRQPLLLLHGTRDSFIPHGHSDRIAARHAPGAEVVKFEGADHVASHAADPARYEAAVLAFLRPALARA